MRLRTLILALVLSCPISPTAAAYAAGGLNTSYELECLAKNIYHEARGESKEGQLAVAYATINRLGKYGRTICQVVYKKHAFSWTASPRKRIRNWGTYYKILALAKTAYYNKTPDPINGRTHYYAHNSIPPPYWVARAYNVIIIGNHKFMLLT